MPSSKLVYVKHSAEIDVYHTLAHDYPGLADLTPDEVIEIAMEGGEQSGTMGASVSLPIAYAFSPFKPGEEDYGWTPEDGHGGPPVEDPLTLDVCLPLAACDDAVVYRVSLADVVYEEMMGWGTNGDLPPPCEGMRAFARALRSLADKIMAADREAA